MVLLPKRWRVGDLGKKKNDWNAGFRISEELAMNSRQLLRAAQDAALARYASTTGRQFPCKPNLVTPDDPEFVAFATPEGGGVRIQINTGTIDVIKLLWQDVAEFSALLPVSNQLSIPNIDQAIDLSLMWLILHELHHYEMGHFDYIHGTELAGNSLGLTSRAAPKVSGISLLEDDEQVQARQCLELQADDDASDMLFDLYHEDNWETLRLQAACISVVMILIEREEQKMVPDQFYPKAATRMFMLLGRLAQMHSTSRMSDMSRLNVNSDRSQDLAFQQEVAKFNAQVVAPAFVDAQIIAQAGNTQNVIDDLGDAGDFFRDVITAQTAAHNRPELFTTTGAKEWSTLWAVNQKVMASLKESGLQTRLNFKRKP